jgi:hypothetical protein
LKTVKGAQKMNDFPMKPSSFSSVQALNLSVTEERYFYAALFKFYSFLNVLVETANKMVLQKKFMVHTSM